MPVATAPHPVTARPLTSSPLASSSNSSPSNSVTLSQAKNFYNQAARNFLHRRHVDALLAAEKAFLAFQDEHLKDRSLAERLTILRLTLLATVYRPQNANRELDIFNQVKKSGKLSLQDQNLIIALEALLILPPEAFLSRLWIDILRFYVEALPRIHSVTANIPPISTTQIVAEADTMSSALQLPAGVVAAAIMGALKIDDETKQRDEINGVKSKKEVKTRPKSEADISKGLQSARSMCEWVMSAHSKLAGTYSSFSATEKDHLYQQYTRVLELYTLHILGTRLDQWELAHEVARCAVEIREDEQELHDRQALLDSLASAQIHLSTRGERRRIASEKARQRYEDEKSKRAASAEQQAKLQTNEGTKKGANSNGVSDSISTPKNDLLKPALPKLGRSDSGLSNASSSTSASEMESEGGIPSRRKPKEANKSGPNGDYAEKRGHISNQIDRHHKRSPLATNERESESTSARGRHHASNNVLQDQIMTWIRSISGNPYILIRYLSAIVATLFILKRAITPARSSPSIPKRVGAATETTRTRLEQAKRQDESLIVTGIRKIWSTLRMGTQVTYL